MDEDKQEVSKIISDTFKLLDEYEKAVKGGNE